MNLSAAINWKTKENTLDYMLVDTKSLNVIKDIESIKIDIENVETQINQIIEQINKSANGVRYTLHYHTLTTQSSNKPRKETIAVENAIQRKIKSIILIEGKKFKSKPGAGRKTKKSVQDFFCALIECGLCNKGETAKQHLWRLCLHATNKKCPTIEKRIRSIKGG